MKNKIATMLVLSILILGNSTTKIIAQNPAIPGYLKPDTSIEPKSFYENATAGEGWGYKDRDGNVIIKGSYYEANNFHEGFGSVQKYKGANYGYVDASGNIVIPAKYTKTRDFEQGIAAVLDYNKWGFIDKTNKVIIPFEYDNVSKFVEGLCMVKKDTKCGFIDKTNKVIIPFDYDDAWDFNNGLCRVKKGKKYGCIDKTGAIVIPFNYDWINLIEEDLYTVKDGNKWGYLDKNGNTVIPFEKYITAKTFSGGLAAVKQDPKKGYGFIDKKGTLVIPYQFSDITEFNSGRVGVKNMDGKWGFVDVTGKIVVPLIYDQTSYGNENFIFSEGFAVVRLGGGYDQKWMLIDTMGKIIIQFPKNTYSVLPFKNGLAKVTLGYETTLKSYYTLSKEAMLQEFAALEKKKEEETKNNSAISNNSPVIQEVVIPRDLTYYQGDYVMSSTCDKVFKDFKLNITTYRIGEQMFAEVKGISPEINQLRLKEVAPKVYNALDGLTYIPSSRERGTEIYLNNERYFFKDFVLKEGKIKFNLYYEKDNGTDYSKTPPVTNYKILDCSFYSK